MPRRLLAGLMFGAVLCAPAHAQTAASPEYSLKAAFIYNFALFTAWGERADRTIHLCVLGRDPFGAALDPLEGKEVGSARLSIRRLRSLTDLHQCQIIYITESELDNFMARSDLMRDNAGVLTIADREGAARAGIMIELTSEDRKIGFEFNQESARINRVQVSSKLLRIARKVY